MNLLKDLWAHLKEWSDWKMKDWIKAAIVASDAAVTFSPFVVRKNKGAGPKGQTSNMQIKKVPFKGVK